MNKLFTLDALRYGKSRNPQDLLKDLANPFFRQNPYPYYSELRKRSPVHYFKKHDLWGVSRYNDIIDVLKRPDVFVVPHEGAGLRTIINVEPSDHQRLRKTVSRFFTAPRIGTMENRIRDHTNRLMEKIIPAKRFDLISGLSEPLSLTVIAEILGVAPEHSEKLKEWSLAFIVKTNSSPRHWRELAKNKAAIYGFFLAQVQKPKDVEQNNLLSELTRSSSGTINYEEIASLATLLYLAGHVTTTHLIGNAVRAMLQHPDVMKIVMNDLTLIPAIIEETLRYDTPAQMIPRVVLKDAEISGVSLRAGATILVFYGSANRDENHFPDPDRFDLHRQTAGHVAFGDGPHYCLGASLARLVARIALETLLQKSGLRAAQSLDQVELCDYLYIRGLKRLNLVR